MSDAPESSPAEALLFPAFMYGDRTTCRRKMKAEAKKWAKCYVQGREFPEPKLIAVPPGTVVFTGEHMAHMVAQGYSFSFSPQVNIVTIAANPRQEGRHIQWRPYLLKDLQHETEWVPKLDNAECFAFRSVFVPFVCRSAWGAIGAAVIPCLLNSIELTVPRIEGVLRFWEALDTLKYIDSDEHPMSLSDLINYYFCGQIAMWADQPTGNIRTDLQTAIDLMRNASADEIHARLIKRLRDYVDIKKGLQMREWLKSPGVIEAGLEAERQLGQDLYDNLTSGANSELGSFLMLLVRDHAPTVH
ncbi:MAG TPA: hypothetical protein PK156_29885 [Polyangium sp.]|nr:hypothetical protein [Polyangium sp.]